MQNLILADILKQYDSKDSKKKSIVQNENVSKTKIQFNFSEIKLIAYDIPERFHSITKLYLSNNNISDLTGIEVFKNLQYLSLANNYIISFDEILKIPTGIISISIKGNFIEKNPQLYILLINRFKNLNEIDGFKVSEDTKKTIEAGRNLRLQIIPLVSIIEELTYESVNLVNKIKVNLELNGLFRQHEQKTFPGLKIYSINKLLEKLNISINFEDHQNLKEKYLKATINPSVFIINKIFASLFKKKLNYSISIESDDKSNNKQSSKSFNQLINKQMKINHDTYYNPFFNQNKQDQNYSSVENSDVISPHIIVSDAIGNYFKESNRINLANIYRNLFESILKNFIIKSNYNSLPCYLNYLVIKSNKDFESFILTNLKSDKKYFDYLNVSKLSEEKLLIYACKNLDKLFLRYTNRSSNLLLKLQMMQFFKLDPSHSSITGNGFTVQNNKKSKIIKNESNEIRHFCNPFSVRLNQSTDIFPSKEKTYFNKISFDEHNNNIDYEFDTDLLNLRLNEIQSNSKYSGQKNIADIIINVDSLEVACDKFFNNFGCLEFPVFVLNFDYMRALTSVLQDKVMLYVECFDEIKKINEELTELHNKLNPNKKYKEYESQSVTNLNDHISYTSKHSNNSFNKGISYNNRNNTISVTTRELVNQDKYIKDSLKNFNKKSEFKPLSKENLIQINNTRNPTTKIECSILILDKLFKCYFYSIFSTQLKSIIRTKESILFIKRILKIIEKNIKIKQNSFFSNLFKLFQKKFNIEKTINLKNIQIKKKCFGFLKVLLKKQILVKKEYQKKLKGKTFYALVKNYYEEKYEREKISNARVFYFRNLIKKGFNLLKFNKFIGGGISQYSKINEICNDKNHLTDIEEENYNSIKNTKNYKETDFKQDNPQDSQYSNPFINSLSPEVTPKNTNKDIYCVNDDLENLMKKLQSHLVANTQTKIMTKNQLVNAVYNTNQSNILTTQKGDVTEINFSGVSPILQTPNYNSKINNQNSYTSYSKSSSKVDKKELIGHPSFLKKTKTNTYKGLI